MTMKIKKDPMKKGERFADQRNSRLYEIKSCKPSPLVKAYNNFDEFYRSIRPSKIKAHNDSNSDLIFKGKQEILVSYYSKKSSNFGEDESIEKEAEEKIKTPTENEEELLSNIITSEQLRLFINKLNTESISKENQEYWVFRYNAILQELEDKLKLICS